MGKTAIVLFAIIVSLFYAAGRLEALDSELVLNGADGWSELALTENIVKRPGKWGYEDLALRDAEYGADESTDCLLHFDAAETKDASGNYSVESNKSLFSGKDFMFGTGSAAFQSNENSIILAPAKKSCLFSMGNLWDDFSIELWLCPVYLSENEEIFSWEGAVKRGEGIVPQSVRCTIRNRRLFWELADFFTIPGGSKTVALPGIKELLPRAWHHHLVHYDCTTGLFEYLLDGIPEAVTYVTDTGKESGRVYRPFTGDVLPSTIRIGGNYTGFIDEMRMTRAFVTKPVLKKYANIRGRADSVVFDLGGSGSLSRRIIPTDSMPGNSFVSYFIRSSDSLFTPDTSADPQWREIEPKKSFDPLVEGRYVQIACTLFPDGTNTISPRVSRIILVAEKKLPPPAPIGLMAKPGNGKVTLEWKRVNYQDIKGYRVYYGEAPGVYDGKGADTGSSPIDAGSSTGLEIGGLVNGTLYYFAVVAYDSEAQPNISGFSDEVSARPLGLLK
jgi:hypothetical protein